MEHAGKIAAAEAIIGADVNMPAGLELPLEIH